MPGDAECGLALIQCHPESGAQPMRIVMKFSTTCLFIALGLFLSAGCNSGEPSTARQPGEPERIVVEFWHALSQAHLGVIEEFAQEFETENPGIAIQPIYQGQYNQLKLNLNNALSANSPPAVALMYEGWTSEFIENGRLAPLQDFIDKDAESAEVEKMVQDIFPGFLANNMRDGRLVSLPFNKSTFIVYYNKERLAKAGYDELPDTLEGVVEAIGKMTERDSKGAVTFFGCGVRATLEPFTTLLFARGGGYMKGEGENLVFVNTPEAREALGMLRKLMVEDGVAFVDPGYLSGPFGSERIGLYFDTSAGLPFALKDAAGKFTVGTASLPAPAGVDPLYLSQGTNIGIFEGVSEAQREAAYKFLKFLMRPENTSRWAAKTGYLPVRRAALEQTELKEYIAANPHYQTCLNQLERLGFEPTVSYWEQVRGELGEELERVYRGRATVNEALEAAEQRAKNVMQRATKK